MDIDKLAKRFQNCPCGRKHESGVRAVHIAPGIVRDAGRLLKDGGFPRNILLVADENTVAAAKGIFPALNGFSVRERIYKDKREPFMEDVDEIVRLSDGRDGILSVGSGTLNDICRLAAFRSGKAFAIFATAPSMDGFASKDAPIVKDGFKLSYPAAQPSVIIGDSEILARAPVRLKSAGFGDMMGKYTALVDWQAARLLTGEYLCRNVYDMTFEAAERIFRMADGVTRDDPETAGHITECLILTGMGMAFTGNSRPASGTEHIVSHFWDITRLAAGEQPDFHGLQVGVATLLISRLYNGAARFERAARVKERTDWDKVYAVYGARAGDIRRANSPSVMDEILPGAIEKRWGEIRGHIKRYLDTDAIEAAMRAAGCPTDIAGIGITPRLCEAATEYHPYMRRRMTLARAMKAIEFA
ncbi:MAG: iron-containing alcohol dehydrogenase [Clostridiales bacterium]|jgi:glycerol-1-phosphate dehydrogenase [NAD(P)+]|nr:iron-containing alcohol dehydrogenase [Clostridiales bacterium]